MSPSQMPSPSEEPSDPPSEADAASAREAPSETADGTARIRVDHPLETVDRDTMLEELRAGLASRPLRLPSKYFYDDHGSELFERITEQPEYYQTRTEAKLLAQAADDVIRRTGACELVEIGSGASTKTRILLDAMERADQLHLYVPMDVSEGIVRRVARELVERYPGLRVHAVVGDFMEHLGVIPDPDERLVIFLGGTIGNLEPEVARGFLSQLGAQMHPGEHLLLGVDRIKEQETLEAAYNDAAGVTAEFNLNILRVVNRLADADFDPEDFRHQARWNPERHRIEMWLIARRDVTVRLDALDRTLELASGEEILTEISTKYDRGLAAELLAESGFELERWYTDGDDLFALCLAVKT